MCETYREQLARLVHSLGRGHWQDAVDDLEAGFSSSERLRLFLKENNEKRFENLNDQLHLVAEAFDDFEQLIDVYIHQHPLKAYDSGTTDGERMLLWLLDKKVLKPVQRDYVLYQRARNAVEELARCDRDGHRAFQAMRRAWQVDRATDLGACLLQINPIRAHTTFVTNALLGSRANPPTEVLLFPDGEEIVTAVLEPEALSVLLVLVGMAPCTLMAWQQQAGDARTELVTETALFLLDRGLLAAQAN